MPISRPHRTRTPQGADVTPRVGYYVVICTTNHVLSETPPYKTKSRPPTPYIFFKDLPPPHTYSAYPRHGTHTSCFTHTSYIHISKVCFPQTGRCTYASS
jgi:hypothetical protein